MEAWTDPTPGGVILHPRAQEEVSTLMSRLVTGPAGALVERWWAVSWELGPGEWFRSSLVPQLSCNLSVEQAGRPEAGADPVVVTGVPSRRFDVDLTGSGWVVGVKFHPGALAGVCGARARDLVDRTVPAGELLPAAVVEGMRPLTPALGPDRLDQAVTSAVTPLLELADDAWPRAWEVVRQVAGDSSITTVARLSAASGLSERSLQRLMERYVGLSPKRVIVRHRLQDVVAQLDAGTGETLADLAARLGFYDQAHLAREFSAFVGVPPSAYRAGAPVP